MCRFQRRSPSQPQRLKSSVGIRTSCCYRSDKIVEVNCCRSLEYYDCCTVEAQESPSYFVYKKVVASPSFCIVDPPSSIRHTTHTPNHVLLLPSVVTFNVTVRRNNNNNTTRFPRAGMNLHNRKQKEQTMATSSFLLSCGTNVVRNHNNAN